MVFYELRRPGVELIWFRRYSRLTGCYYCWRSGEFVAVHCLCWERSHHAHVSLIIPLFLTMDSIDPGPSL